MGFKGSVCFTSCIVPKSHQVAQPEPQGISRNSQQPVESPSPRGEGLAEPAEDESAPLADDAASGASQKNQVTPTIPVIPFSPSFGWLMPAFDQWT